MLRRKDHLVGDLVAVEAHLHYVVTLSHVHAARRRRRGVRSSRSGCGMRNPALASARVMMTFRVVPAASAAASNWSTTLDAIRIAIISLPPFWISAGAGARAASGALRPPPFVPVKGFGDFATVRLASDGRTYMRETC